MSKWINSHLTLYSTRDTISYKLNKENGDMEFIIIDNRGIWYEDGLRKV